LSDYIPSFLIIVIHKYMYHTINAMLSIHVMDTYTNVTTDAYDSCTNDVVKP